MTKFYWQFLWKLIIIIKPCALGQFLAKIKASVNDSNLFPIFFTFKPTLVNCKCVNEISIKHKHRYMYIICIVGSMYLLLIFNFLWKEKFDPGNEKKNEWGDSNPAAKDELIYKPNIIRIAYEVLLVSYVRGSFKKYVDNVAVRRRKFLKNLI